MGCNRMVHRLLYTMPMSASMQTYVEAPGGGAKRALWTIHLPPRCSIAVRHQHYLPTSGRERDRIIPLCYKSPTEDYRTPHAGESAVAIDPTTGETIWRESVVS